MSRCAFTWGDIRCLFPADHPIVRRTTDKQMYRHGCPTLNVWWDPVDRLRSEVAMDEADIKVVESWEKGWPQPNTEPDHRPVDVKQTEAELRNWWMTSAGAEIESMAGKAAAYGSNSLAAMGRLLRPDADLDEALELGCFLYAYGKMERWHDAILRGQRPGADTLHDIHVYAKMAEKIRETKTWP